MEYFEKYEAQASAFRGAIINSTVVLERMIDVYISCHFCKTRRLRGEFISTVISANYIMASKKKDLFAELLKRHDPDFLKENPGIIKMIEKVYINRNIYAHQQMDTTREQVEKFDKYGIITFTKFGNFITTIECTQSEVNAWASKANDLAYIINNLLTKKQYLPL